MEIISRAEAKARGLKRYFTGKACKHGHIAERYVSTGVCYECKRIECLKYYHEVTKADPEKLEKARESNRKATAKYAQENHEKHRGRSRKWAQENPHKANAKTAKRRAAKLQATTAWGSEGLSDFYLAADMANLYTGQPVHVGHILPLVSRKVCGLHNEFNLQIMYGSENCSKSNKFDLDSYVH